MLELIQPVQSIELTADNPYLVIESESCDYLYAHVYRKGQVHKKDECFLEMPFCHKPRNVEIDSPYPDEWLSSRGTPHKFCIPGYFFNSAPGVWAIDIFHEMEVEIECSNTDPNNFYRKLKKTRKAGNVCKQYEFHVGDLCSKITLA